MNALRKTFSVYVSIFISAVLLVQFSDAFSRPGNRTSERGQLQARRRTTSGPATDKPAILQRQGYVTRRAQAVLADSGKPIAARRRTAPQNRIRTGQPRPADARRRIASRLETAAEPQRQLTTEMASEGVRSADMNLSMPAGVTRRPAPGTTIGICRPANFGVDAGRRRAAVLNYDRWRNPHSGGRIYQHVIRPPHYKRVCYFRGPRPIVRVFRPRYHRKYIFVSLGGWWPSHYRYARYYWYGWHPFYWYGSYPVMTRWGGDTYNYYTYNYYGQEQSGIPSTVSSGQLEPADHTTFQDVRDRMAQQQADDGEPAEATEADNLFARGVETFEDGRYKEAAEIFQKAAELEPADVVLPFARIQALFAAEEYTRAAEALREAALRLEPEQEGLFFPRGLYPNDGILSGQIDRLLKQAEVYRHDADLKLLAGYQLMGEGRYQQAGEQLREARSDILNAPAAEKLLRTLEKLQDQVKIQPDQTL